MSLKESIIKIKPREISGPRSSNRFSFQHHWALTKLIDLIEEKQEFALVLDYHDDILILDNITEPQKAEFYQIKSNKKKNEHYFTPKRLTAKKKDKDGNEELSYLGKMIDHFNNFKEDVNKLEFVSNKYFDFEIDDKNDTKTFPVVYLKDVSDKDLKIIHEDICSLCWRKDNCSNECNNLFSFCVTELDPLNYPTTVIGKIAEFFNSMKQYNINTIAAKNTFISEIELKNNNELECNDYKSLIENRSITSSDFNNMVTEIIKVSSVEKDWPSIRTMLLNESYSLIQVKSIKKYFERYYLERLSNANSIINKIKNIVSECVSTISASTLREHIDPILLEIKSQSFYDEIAFPENYLVAIILIEVLSDE